MNQMTKQSGGLLAGRNLAALKAAAVAASQKATVASFDGADILKMTQEGEWVRGMENAPVDVSQPWVFHALSLGMSWVCWKGGKPVDEKNLRWIDMADNSLPEDETGLPNHGPYGKMEGWTQGAFGTAFQIDDPEDHVQYKPNSYGGRKAVQGLIDAIGRQLTMAPDYLHPVVMLESDSYYNKSYQKDIATPILRIVDWGDDDGNLLSKAPQQAAIEEHPGDSSAPWEDAGPDVGDGENIDNLI